MHCPGREFIVKKLSGGKTLKLIKSGAEFKKLLLLWNLTLCEVSSETLWDRVPLQYHEENFPLASLSRFQQKGPRRKNKPHVLWVVGGTSMKSFISNQDKPAWTLSSSWCERSVVLHNREEMGSLSLAVFPSHGYLIHIKTVVAVRVKYCIVHTREK